jgi:hypothetical protein
LEHLAPPFWDDNAYQNGTLNAQLTIGSTPYSTLTGNPNDPKVLIDGMGPTWWLQLMRLGHRIVAPFVNAEYIQSLAPNVDINLYYSSYAEGTFRVNGIVVSNQSNKMLVVGNVLIEGEGYSQVVYPLVEDTLGDLVIVPPSVDPGETAMIAFDICDVELIHPIGRH